MRTVAEILDEERVPDRELVVHRRDELDRLLTRFDPARGTARLGYLLGPTGTGKTMLARLALDRLEAEWQVDTTYVNCWSHHERTEILFQVADAVVDEPLHRNSTGRGELIASLEAEPDRPRYVVLDEADQLADTAVLYDLHRAPGLRLLLVANDEVDLLAGVDDRVRSRLSVGARIECDRYPTRELAEILERRVRAAGVAIPDDRMLEEIAARADGDARVAIRTLRVAIENRRASGDRSMTDTHIDAALPTAKDQLRQKSRGQLHDHQLAVLAVIEEQGPLAPQAIHAQYRDRVADPRTERTVRNYLKKLRQYNLIDRSGSKHDRTYRALTTDD